MERRKSKPRKKKKSQTLFASVCIKYLKKNKKKAGMRKHLCEHPITSPKL